jgi:hypothetical protein
MNPARDIGRIWGEFEAAWQGVVPKVEEFVGRIDEEQRPTLLAALMPLDLTGEVDGMGELAILPSSHLLFPTDLRLVKMVCDWCGRSRGIH